jgi:ribonuclease HI
MQTNSTQLNENAKPIVEIYTDGVYFPDPQLGGIATIFKLPDDKVMNYSQGFENTDTPRMKLTSVINALDMLADLVDNQTIKTGIPKKLITDSEYIVDIILQGWLPLWKSKGWVTSSYKPVKNTDLLEQLLFSLDRIPSVCFVKVASLHHPNYNKPPNYNRAIAGLDCEQSLYYFKRCNDMAVEAFRALEREIKNRRK